MPRNEVTLEIDYATLEWKVWRYLMGACRNCANLPNHLKCRDCQLAKRLGEKVASEALGREITWSRR